MSIRSRLFGETRQETSDGVRDPTAATQLLTYASPGVRQIPEWDADSAIREAYLSSVIVYAAVTARAKALASCPLRAVLPGKDVADHNPNAPLAKLLGPAPGGPNPNLSARRLWANATTNYIVTGKFAWELEAPAGASMDSSNWAPVRIWPLIARVFDVIPTDGGMQLFQAFKYGRGDRKVILKPSQVFYTYNPSLNDSRQAASALQALRYDILAEVMQSIYDAAFLRNDARPAGMIVKAAFGEESQRRAWEQQFEANHRSAQNANRMAFDYYEGEADPKSVIQFINMGLSQKDAQMLATQQSKVQRISMGLGVPMSMLDTSGRTFDNASQDATNFWMNTVVWDIADFEDEINRNLAPRLGPEIAKFDTRHIEALKPQSRFLPMSVGDAIDRKVILAKEGRTEMGWGDMPPELLAMQDAAAGSNMTEQAALITGLAALAATPELLPWAAQILGLPAPPAVEKPEPPQPLQLPPGAIKPVNKQTWSESLSVVRELRRELARAETRAATWRAQSAQVDSAEAPWVGAIRRLFGRQLAATLGRLTSRWTRWLRDPKSVNVEEVFDPAFQTTQTAEVLTGLFESLVASSGARVGAQHGFTFDVAEEPVTAMIDRRVSKLANQVTTTTYDAIRSVVLSGIENGSSMETIASGVEAVFSEADSRRAMLIARTETIAATADGALASYRQAVAKGLIDSSWGKVWIGTEDNRECPICDALNGEKRAFDAPFSNGEDAPPGHPDCRCAIGAEPLDPTDRMLHSDDVRSILHAIADGSLSTGDLVA